MPNLKTQISTFAKRYAHNTYANYIKVGAIVFGVAFAVGHALWREHIFNMPVPHIALVKIEGTVERGSRTGDGGILSDAILSAMKDDLAHAVLIEANSPGGSPVQAEQLHQTILSLRDTTHKPIYVSIGETCASACLYMASAGDQVFAHKNSLIGSIGVRMDSWGVNRLMEDLHIERRTYSAGKHKALLDPFMPRDPVAEEHLKEYILEPLYLQFVEALKEGRGDKLAADHEKLFTGLIWNGQQAVELGLVDDIATHVEVREWLKKRYQVTTIQNYSRESFSFRKLLTSDFWGDVIASAVTKLSSDSHTKVTY